MPDETTNPRALDPFGFPWGVTPLFIVVVVVGEIVIFNRAGRAELSFFAMLVRLVAFFVAAMVAYSIVGIIYRARLRRADPALARALDERDQARVAQAAAEKRARNAYAEGALTPVAPGHGIVPLPGETFYWTCDDVRLIGDREQRTFRTLEYDNIFDQDIARTTETDKHLRDELDRGTLALSDRRVLFVGKQQPRAIAFENVVLFTADDHGFDIAVANAAPFSFVTGRKEEGVVVQRLMHGDVGSHEPAVQP